jgi:murein DD-endopeptidase MepM/ murein hydrolase activator NlpD
VAETQKKKFIKRLRTTLRLVVMNDDTFEEKFSLRLTPLNVFVVIGTLMLTLITLTTYLIAFTSLREYIPGYADVSMKRKLVNMSLATDSLAQKIETQNKYLANLNFIVSGTLPVDKIKDTAATVAIYDSIRVLQKSAEDSLLRMKIEGQDKFDIAMDGDEGAQSGIAGFYFFTPLKGTITSVFDTRKKHYGVDVVAPPDAVIKAVLDGTVIVSDFTSETGHTIAIQHRNDLISFYKHNSVLLKKPGDFVKAGDVIAIIGNSGEFTTGPHLHFELWYNGTAVNPVDYIKF